MADELIFTINPAILAAIVREQPTEDDDVIDDEPGDRARHEAQRSMLADLISSISAEELAAGLRLEISIRHNGRPIASVELEPSQDRVGMKLVNFSADYSDWVSLDLGGEDE